MIIIRGVDLFSELGGLKHLGSIEVAAVDGVWREVASPGKKINKNKCKKMKF